jgi:hypothetical protein
MTLLKSPDQQTSQPKLKFDHGGGGVQGTIDIARHFNVVRT